MAPRHLVEEYLGQLEGQGYLADRLELPLLDELRSTRIKGNGAWIFPNLGGRDGTFMAAWWYEGVLQNLSIAHLPPGEARGKGLQEQLAQASWAGELEGWLTSDPIYHLVTDEATAAQWLPLFDPAQAVEILPPLPLQELAAQTARRVATNGSSTNLLPPEYAGRYRQQFMDRLWMHGLGAILVLYVLGVIVYFGFVQAASYRYGKVQDRLAELGPEYTNTIKLHEELKVLQDTLELQYAALDCYRSVADTLPTELTLNQMNFERGRKVTFFGTSPTEDRSKVNDFNARLMDHMNRGQRLYSRVNPPSGQQNQTMFSWNFSCDLKRTDVTE